MDAPIDTLEQICDWLLAICYLNGCNALIQHDLKLSNNKSPITNGKFGLWVENPRLHL
jgi:hypothetical protein